MTANEESSPGSGWRGNILPLAILVLVLIVSVIVRIRLLDAPLERDEGEHGYLAQTLLEGYAPWQVAYNLKLPGTDAMYAIFLALFGQTATAIRLGLLLVNTATILLLVPLGKRLFGMLGGLVAGAAYGLLACSYGVLGTIAHATHFVAFFAVLATLLLLNADESPGRIFLAGLACGVAFLMKQPGLAFGAFGLLYVAWRWRQTRAPFRHGIKALAAYCLGLALPYAILCLALWRAGTFPRFWFWTVTLTRAYASQTPLSLAPKYFAHEFPGTVDSNLFLWILAGLGLALACWNPRTRRAGLFTGALLVFSFLAVSAGNVFNPHYFVMMLPSVALAIGAFVAAADGIVRRSAANQALVAGGALLFFAMACLCSILLQRAYLFSMSPYDFERSSYGTNPFPEAVQVAEYIRTHSDPGERIAVMGSEAEIYFYSRRRAATGYIFTYGLMETHEYAFPSQVEMMHEIETAMPRYIVFVGMRTSWLIRPGSSRQIIQWVRDYADRYYDIAGVVNLYQGESATYTWGPDASIHNAASEAFVTVYRRR